MKRIVDFSISSQLTLQLAYYPPYHSKYNPIERCFGWLEQHWGGSLLDSVETLVSGIIRGDSTVMFSMVTLDNKPKES